MKGHEDVQRDNVAVKFLVCFFSKKYGDVLSGARKGSNVLWFCGWNQCSSAVKLICFVRDYLTTFLGLGGVLHVLLSLLLLSHLFSACYLAFHFDML